MWNTDLHLATKSAEVERLLAAGGDVDARDHGNRTPLHCAAWDGRVTIASILLDHGADIHAVDGMGRTPLHWAIEADHPKMVRLLVGTHADVNRGSGSGETPLQVAANSGWVGLNTAELLLSRGAP